MKFMIFFSIDPPRSWDRDRKSNGKKQNSSNKFIWVECGFGDIWANTQSSLQIGKKKKSAKNFFFYCSIRQMWDIAQRKDDARTINISRESNHLLMEK